MKRLPLLLLLCPALILSFAFPILAQDDQISVQGPLVGGDRDEHGCIGSAGYIWCEPLNKCIRPWEEKCGEDETAEVRPESIPDFAPPPPSSGITESPIEDSPGNSPESAKDNLSPPPQSIEEQKE